MSTPILETPKGVGDEVVRGDHRLRRILANQQFILLVVLTALIIFFATRNSLFFTTSEFSNLITDFSGLILIAAAETFVITSGGIDLAVGSTSAVAGVVGAFAMQGLLNGHMNEMGVLLIGTLVCAGVGVVAGIVSSVLITKFMLVPFVATLITFSAGAGLALVFSKGAPIGYNPNAITWSATGLGMFTWLAIIVIAIALTLGLLLHFTRYGRYNFAIGSNSFAARVAGINVQRHIASVYVLSGALAGLTGMFFYIRGGSGAPTTGVTNSANLQAIAAVVIGGASLTGGVGRYTGTLLGAAILTVVTDGLIFINVPPTWIQVVVAGLIAVATILQSIRPAMKREQ